MKLYIRLQIKLKSYKTVSELQFVNKVEGDKAFILQFWKLGPNINYHVLVLMLVIVLIGLIINQKHWENIQWLILSDKCITSIEI